MASAASGTEAFQPRIVCPRWTIRAPEKGFHYFYALHALPERSELIDYGFIEGFWLFRAESGVCGLLPSKISMAIDEKPITTFGLLVDGQKIAINGEIARFEEIWTLRLGEASRYIGRKCLFCQEPHSSGKTVRRCPYCGEVYCAECWDELIGDRCCSRNCSYFAKSACNSEAIEHQT
jgi:hypothetical protein